MEITWEIFKFFHILHWNTIFQYLQKYTMVFTCGHLCLSSTHEINVVYGKKCDSAGNIQIVEECKKISNFNKPQCLLQENLFYFAFALFSWKAALNMYLQNKTT